MSSKTIDKAVNLSKKETVESQDIVNKIENQESSEVENSPVYVLKAKNKIPMDAMVIVKSCVKGLLIYVSKKQTGYSERWSDFGEDVPMEMKELYSMKNTDKKFFTENWIEVDPMVLRDLNMEKYYKDAISIEEMNNLFNLSAEELEPKLDAMKENMKNAFTLEAIERIENGTFTNLKLITLIEKKFNCELYEH